MSTRPIIRTGIGAITLTAIAMLGGCPAPGPQPGNGTLNAAQKLRAEQITSVFENDTIELQYSYIEDLNDGRGYTAGRAGFTTGTGDLLIVVERYTTAVPGNGLAAFLPRLRELAETGSDATTGLETLPQAWISAAGDASFRAIQDEVVDEMYFRPALARCAEIGLTWPLSIAAVYDAIIQHGDGDDPDGLLAMFDRATAAARGNPLSGVDESTWLAAFLDVRRATLLNAFNVATRAEWAMGADRPDVYQDLLNAGNVNLDGPILLNTANHSATIP